MRQPFGSFMQTVQGIIYAILWSLYVWLPKNEQRV
jgi:hypothetical protein